LAAIYRAPQSVEVVENEHIPTCGHTSHRFCSSPFPTKGGAIILAFSKKIMFEVISATPKIRKSHYDVTYQFH